MNAAVVVSNNGRCIREMNQLTLIHCQHLQVLEGLTKSLEEMAFATIVEEFMDDVEALVM